MKQKVNDIVVALMNDVASFTSLDISNLVKREGLSVRHRDVASTVRDLYDNGFMDSYSYERTTIDVTLANGSSSKAFLYHHCMTSPDTYNRRSQVAIPPSTVPAAVINANPPSVSQSNTTVTTTAATTTIATPAPIQTRNQKSDCRLEVPASWVRELGWTDGDTLYLCDNTAIIKVKHPDDVTTTDRIVGTVIISGGRLRIPKSAFDKANFSHGPGHQINVTLFGDHVLVEN